MNRIWAQKSLLWLNWSFLASAILYFSVCCKSDPVDELIKNRKCHKCNLVGRNLQGLDLKSVSLIGANLKEADLANTDLSFANLSSADLSHAKLRHAKLVNAFLLGADLTLADLSGVDLTGADLTAIRFHKTTMPDGETCSNRCELRVPNRRRR